MRPDRSDGESLTDRERIVADWLQTYDRDDRQFVDVGDLADRLDQPTDVVLEALYKLRARPRTQLGPLDREPGVWRLDHL